MKKFITTKQYFFTLNLTYYLQALSILFFSLVVAFLIKGNPGVPVHDAQLWSFVIPLVLIVSLLIAYFIFRTMVRRIKPDFSITRKMPMYGRAVLARSALLQLPGFLTAIAAYLTMQMYFCGGAILIFILFIILRPTKNAIVSDLKLSAKERNMLENEEALISEVNQA